MMKIQAALILVLASITPPNINAANLFTNGDFESGTTAGWTLGTTPFGNTTGACNNPFAAQTTASGCVSGFNPVSGTYAAYSSTSFPSLSNTVGQYTNTMSQTVLIPNNVANATLSWSNAAIWDGVGSFRGINILVQIFAGSTFVQSRFDLINPSASGQFNWSNRIWDVTGILRSYEGQNLTFQFQSTAFFDTRFGQTGAATTLNTGFDNLALDVTVPEPSSYVVVTTALLALTLRFRRRQHC